MTVFAQAWEQVRRVTRRVCPQRVYSMAAEVSDGAFGIFTIGYPTYARLRRLYPSSCSPGGAPERFELPQLQYPFFVRPGTSDVPQLVQNVIRQEWGAWFPTGPIRLIVDAGANIGDTTAWYLSRFPDATVVALEPDPENYAMLLKNCNPYGTRAVLLKAALWPRRAQLQLVRADAYDAISVDEPPSVAVSELSQGVSVPCILEALGADVIDVLKCDIEGAERPLFTSHPEEWLPRVRSLVIEIHGPIAGQAVYGALSALSFKSRMYRNTHIFWRA